MKFAILIHIVDWKYYRNSFQIDDGILFVKLGNHPVERLYQKLCEDTGIDDGEPYVFNSALLLHDEDDEDEGDSFLPTTSPRSLASIIFNILTLINGRPLNFCRVIASKDDFVTSWSTYELYDPLAEDFYEFRSLHLQIDFDSRNLKLVQRIWKNLKSVWTSGHSRIDNAFIFYYLSWNTHTLEQMAISLSIVMETLFSPDANSELSHQISFNLAQFIGTTKSDKLEKYKLTKKYYTIRSKLVHGEKIRDAELDVIPDFFDFLSSVLIKIMSNHKLIAIFNQNEKRKEYLRNNLFNA